MFQYSTIEEALEELRQGRMILCTDDPDRENEGDLICAAQSVTTEQVNFMATHGKGLICMPMSRELVSRLQIPQMVSRNTDNHETAFTVSIDHVDTTTGIQKDRWGGIAAGEDGQTTAPTAGEEPTYTAYVDFTPDESVRLGMTVLVYTRDSHDAEAPEMEGGTAQ